MSGKKGRSGRHKNATSTLKYFNEQFDKHSDELIDQLFSLALQGNKDIIVYCFDRRLGRPHQSQDLRVRAERVYSPDELKLMNYPIIEETRLLDEWRADGSEALSKGMDQEQEINES